MTALSRVAAALVCSSLSARRPAADAPARPAGAGPGAGPPRPTRSRRRRPRATTREPVVQRTVIDDGRAVIEELRVRGQLVKATVHPKDGSPSYEIIVGDGSRELSTEGGNNSRGATGKRVWKS